MITVFLKYSYHFFLAKNGKLCYNNYVNNEEGDDFNVNKRNRTNWNFWKKYSE